MRALKIMLVLVLLTWSERGSAQHGLLAEYYNNIELEGVAFSRYEKKPGFNQLKKNPAPGIRSEYFSVRWTGKIFAPVSGEYKFIIQADDGARLWVDNQLIVDQWREQEATTFEGYIILAGKSYYDIRIEYFNTILHAVMLLSWENPEDEYMYFGRTVRPRLPIAPVYFYSKAPDIALPVKQPSPQVVTKPRQPSSTRKVIEHDKPIVLKSIHFEQTKAHLPQHSYRELDELASYLRASPALSIEIIGHTDYAGDSVSNYQLSQDRAQAVANYLVAKGVSPERVRTKAMGSSKPKIISGRLEDRAENRRVEFILSAR